MNYDLQFARVGLARAIGPRLAKATFDNYKTNELSAQLASDLRGYVGRLDEVFASGDGIALVGNCGTGKDHLLYACSQAVFDYGKIVRWEFGEDLYSHFRLAMKSDENDADVLREYTAPDVLWISDPLPVTGDLTDAQRRWLMRIIDYRYRWRKPTWLSANSSTPDVFTESIGRQTADRIVGQNGIGFECSWESYRGI